MFNIGFQEMALIGAVALVVIGPEQMPRMARMAGTLLGRAQRYMAEVKAEVNQAMDLDELQRMKQSIEEAGRDVEQSMRAAQAEVDASVREAVSALQGSGSGSGGSTPAGAPLPWEGKEGDAPAYRHPGKKWRLKRSAVPHWYKARVGVRRQVQSGSARVARYRPRRKF